MAVGFAGAEVGGGGAEEGAGAIVGGALGGAGRSGAVQVVEGVAGSGIPWVMNDRVPSARALTFSIRSNYRHPRSAS